MEDHAIEQSFQERPLSEYVAQVSVHGREEPVFLERPHGNRISVSVCLQWPQGQRSIPSS